MKLKILAFGIAKDIFEADHIFVEMPEDSAVKDLKRFLEEKYEDLKKIRTYFVAVDEEYSTENQVLQSGQEIAIIPPVSGG